MVQKSRHRETPLPREESCRRSYSFSFTSALAPWACSRARWPSVRKGSRTHVTTGIVFSVSMLILAATGAYIGYRRSQTGNVIGGIVTLYMVSTAWMAARRRDGQTGTFDWFALAIALAIGTACLTYGYRVAHGIAVPNDGVPAAIDFFFGFIVLLAAAGDTHMLARGGLSSTQRIARHLWRMCFGLFVASGSFFMGRQQIFPLFVRESDALIFLTALPLLLLVFWLVRIRFTKPYGRIHHRLG